MLKKIGLYLISALVFSFATAEIKHVGQLLVKWRKHDSTWTNAQYEELQKGFDEFKNDPAARGEKRNIEDALKNWEARKTPLPPAPPVTPPAPPVTPPAPPVTPPAPPAPPVPPVTPPAPRAPAGSMADVLKGIREGQQGLRPVSQALEKTVQEKEEKGVLDELAERVTRKKEATRSPEEQAVWLTSQRKHLEGRVYGEVQETTYKESLKKRPLTQAEERDLLNKARGDSLIFFKQRIEDNPNFFFTDDKKKTVHALIEGPIKAIKSIMNEVDLFKKHPELTQKTQELNKLLLAIDKLAEQTPTEYRKQLIPQIINPAIKHINETLEILKAKDAS